MSDTEETCFLWGTELKDYRRDPGACRGGGASYVDSPRAGDKYVHCYGGIPHDEALKVKLTSWIVEQNRLGVKYPQLLNEILEQLENSPAMSIQERADNLLRFLNEETTHLGDVFEFYYPAAPKGGAQSDLALKLLAHTASVKPSEVVSVVEYCAGRGWIKHKKDGAIGTDFYELSLAPDGYARLEELDKKGAATSHAFVAMWFDKSMDDAYEHGIKPAIQDCGYEPLRIDKKEHVNRIDDQIIAEIRRSRFVVADFTSGKDKPCAGVYYEAGFAQGLDIPLIWSCRKDSIESPHFDTR